MGYTTTSASRTQAQSTISSVITAFNNPDGTGFGISSTNLVGKEIKQFSVVVGTSSTEPPIILNEGAGGNAVSITDLYVTDSSYNVLDDQAISTSGGYVKIIGTGFKSGAVVYAGGTAALTTTFVSSTEIRAQLGAASSNTLHIYVVNPDNSGAIFLSGIVYSGVPLWNTDEALPGKVSDTFLSIPLSATSDSSVTYAPTDGSILPPGLTVASNGVLSGTVTGISDTTTYSFSVDAIDAENQETARTFTITITFGDEYYRNTVLHLSGETVNNTWISDISTNKFTLTVNGNTKPSPFNPFNETNNATGSAYFDGTGDYLTVADNSAFELTGDFTIEAFFNISSLPGSGLFANIISKGAAGVFQPYYLFINSSGSLLFYSSSNGSSWNVSNGTSLGTVSVNTWYHVAISRSGTSLRLFLNGSLITTITNGNALTDNNRSVTIGARSDGTEDKFVGYISNVRIVKGTAVYTEAFTPPTSPLTVIANTSLLTLQSHIGENNNTFIDSSSSGNFVTRTGNATQGTFSPHSLNGWSTYFDGTDDHITFPNSGNFAFGTGAFTIEFWINAPLNNDKFILGGRGAAGTMHITTGGSGSTAGVLRYVGSSTIVSSNIINDDNWHHCAIVRNGSSNITLYVDGVSRGTGTDSTNYTTTTGNWIVGRNDTAASNYLTGYISNLRVVKGTAVYTEAFTPPKEPLTAITGTSLLMSQSNNFRDNSSNNITLTVNSGTAIQPVGPFRALNSWTPTTVGGSIYFDGATDYLDVSNVDTAFGSSGNFTIDFWMYPTVINSAIKAIIDPRTADTSAHPLIWISAANRLYYFTTNATRITGTTTLTANQWYHVALVRNSGTTTLYLNGSVEGTWADTTNYIASTKFRIGQRYASTALNYAGYIHNLRVVNGTAIYTGAFTPPTAPTTSVSNTTLLMNGTNGGIIDYTGKNNLETIGAVKIKNDVVKYGDSAMYFTRDSNQVGVYLSIPTSPNLGFGTGPFTIEFWMNTASVSEFGAGSLNKTIMVTPGYGSTPFLFQHYGPFLRFWSPGLSTSYIEYGSLTANTWHHVAATRSGTTLRLFVNGVQRASRTDSSNYTIQGLYIGANANGADGYLGYLDDIRITKGVARYTSNFDVPTATFLTR